MQLRFFNTFIIRIELNNKKTLSFVEMNAQSMLVYKLYVRIK